MSPRVGSYRMHIQKLDGSTLYLPLEGHKANWFVYEHNLQQKNFSIIEQRLQKNLDDYVRNHSDLKRDDVAKMSLIVTRVKSKGDSTFEEVNTVVHSVGNHVSRQ